MDDPYCDTREWDTVQEGKGANGQYNWKVIDISQSFCENAAEQYTAMPDDVEIQRIRQHFTDAEYYSSCGYHNRRNRRLPVSDRYCACDTRQITMN